MELGAGRRERESPERGPWVEDRGGRLEGEGPSPVGRQNCSTYCSTLVSGVHLQFLNHLHRKVE